MALCTHEKSGMANATPAILLPPPMVTVEGGVSEVKLTPLTSDSSASYTIRCKLFLVRLLNSY